MLRNLSRFACRVLSGCCFLTVTASTVRAQPLIHRKEVRPRRFCIAPVAFVLLLVCRFVSAQCPPSSPVIPNFRTVSISSTSVTLAWDPPAGAAPGAVYEILGDIAPNYCAFQHNYNVVSSTTATSFSAEFPVPDAAFAIFVRLQIDPCVQTEFFIAADNFTTPPNTPAIPAASVEASDVVLTFSYNDTRTFEVDVFRSAAGGAFVFLGHVGSCDPDPKSLRDSGLAPGTYQYRLGVTNGAPPRPTIFSDPVIVTVGGASPRVASFAASPPTIRAGQSSTLSWVTSDATGVLIDQGVGTQPASGSVTVSPGATTTYTLTAMQGAQTATAPVTVNVITAPAVVISSFPSALFQLPNSGGATAHFTVTNSGGAATTVALSQRGDFFTQTPTSFALPPGASQVVTLTGLAQPPGAQEGASTLSGAGVPDGLEVSVKLLTSAPPSGPVTAQPEANRVDVAEAAGVSPSGTVSFTNTGNDTLTGILVSDVPWIVPQSGVVSIPPHAAATFRFDIDRSKRPDSNALAGSLSGTISLLYLSGAAGKTATPLDVAPVPSVSTVSVVDTVKLTVTAGIPPPLAAGDIVLFVPGVGNVSGSVGLFISDIALLNPVTNHKVDDLRLYYTAVGGGGSKTTAVPSVGSSVSIAFADVVKNVFGTEGQVGSLQIRSRDADKLALSTNIFNSSNPAGTFGTAIPTFRSDRAVGASDRLVLTGLRSDSTSHTNLFIQETAGVGVTVQTEFVAADGSTVGVPRTDTVAPFVLAQINRVVPPGAVSAIITNTSSGAGRFLAYATPVDDAAGGGDNWSVVDWSRQFGYSPTEPFVIPVAGTLHGANGTFFRTDIAIMNTGSPQASGTLRFVASNGSTADRQITLGSRQSNIINDVIGTLFGLSNTAGYLLFTPVTGSFAATSRTYATVGDSSATFGTGVPALAAKAALKVGSIRTFAALEDASLATVVAGRPATFRTNFGLLETSGSSARVRVTLRFTFQAGSKLQGSGTASKDYDLAPNQFRQINGLTADILGPARESLGDLRGIAVDFQIVAGDGAVSIFTSSVDNGTGDSILRTE